MYFWKIPETIQQIICRATGESTLTPGVTVSFPKKLHETSLTRFWISYWTGTQEGAAKHLATTEGELWLLKQAGPKSYSTHLSCLTHVKRNSTQCYVLVKGTGHSKAGRQPAGQRTECGRKNRLERRAQISLPSNFHASFGNSMASEQGNHQLLCTLTVTELPDSAFAETLLELDTTVPSPLATHPRE